MDLNALSLLVDIIDAGNLSQAARQLGMSRANVSKRLNHFERQLGAALLRRSTRQLEPTELGWQLYEHGRAIRQELMAAQESVQSLGKRLSGTVRLSVPSGFGQHTMSAWFIEFMTLYPAITLNVIFDNDIEDLIKGAVDFSVRVMGETPTNAVACSLGDVEYVACATPQLVRGRDMPRTLEQLKGLPLITSELTGQKLNVAGRGGAGSGQSSIRPRLMSANFFFLRDAILQGLGVGLVPQYMVAKDLADGTLLRLPLPAQDLAFLRTTMYLLYMPARYQTRAVTTLIAFLQDKARAAMPAVFSPLPQGGRGAGGGEYR
ncbi:LysR family transcriptional regulator [Cupriavidus gilardii J11]|uniref:LysR family transcriptional regulator n=1 Tax=Cupriavidus gilardii J11 TaxID=936133 RepID=A0A562BVE4_9BURK|nr:LysR family transcriptional regulator [Cupriavidus gilardii]TWG88663.1 LysR family transcriptional regulator [Cupriavidus gilardii J11]